MRRLLFIACLGLLVLLAIGGSSPRPSLAAAPFPGVIDLPNGWLPEGIATGRGPIIYAGSRRDGAIYAADLRTGEGHVVVPSQTGRIAVGLAFDPRTNYIFVAGGPAGAGYVYDAGTGASVGDFSFTAAASFVNDVVVTRDAAYFTDSFQPVLYRVPLGPGGSLPDPAGVETILLSGDYVQMSGFNANGIDATPSGDALIIVQSNTGLLLRVDPQTGIATTIDLGGYSVTNGDGILLLGRTIYVSRNQNNLVARISLSPDLASGSLVEEITAPGLLDTPTTLARFGNGIYAVNARFGAGMGLDVPYTIVRLER